MKALIKVPLFVYIALAATQFFIGSFNFGSNYTKNVELIVLAFSLLFLSRGPVIKIILFPLGCLGSGLLGFILTCILFLVLTVVLPDFSINLVSKLNLINFEIMLPLRNYGMVASLIVSSLMFGLIYNFLDWLCSCRH